jgi:hypothetical protein
MCIYTMISRNLIYALTPRGIKLFFSAGDDGDELWFYDSTLPVKADKPHKNPRMIVSGYLNVSHLTVFNNRLYFAYDDGPHWQELRVMYYN